MPPSSAPTLSSLLATADQAAAAGLGEAWLRWQALEKVAACLIAHWPVPALSIRYILGTSPSGVQSAHLQCLIDDRDPRSTQEKNLLAAQKHMNVCIRALCPVACAELLRVSGLTPLSQIPYLTPKQWRAWPAKHRDPALTAWLRQAELDQALPVSLVRQPPVARL